MSAITLVHIVTNIAFVLLAGVAFWDYLRHRDWFRLDELLMFGVLALISLSQLIILETTWSSTGLAVADNLLLLSQPYLLLRMTRHFRPVGRAWQWAALIGMLLSWAGIILFPANTPLSIVIFLVVYFVAIEGYSALAFFQDARKTGGVTRRRLFLASAGSVMILLVILLAGVTAAFPQTGGLFAPVTQTFGTLSAVCYFLGFASPRWLRRYWQYSELQHFLIRSSQLRAEGQRSQYLQLLCQMAMQTVGGIGASLALWSTDRDDLVIQQSTFSPSISDQPDIAAIDLKRYGREQLAALVDLQPSGVEGAGIISDESRPQAVYVIPVATVERNWGLLLVYIWRAPVFTSDDLDLLRLYSEQAAVSLTYETLLARQETLIKDLNQSQAQLQSVNEDLKQEIFERLQAEKEREKAIREQAAREEAETARARFAFLAEASQVLSSTLDDRTALVSLARLAIPAIADGCEVDLVEPNFSIRAIEIDHIDPQKAALHRQWRELHPITPDSTVAVAEVLRTGRAQLFADLSGANVEDFAHSPEEREIFLQIGYRSSMVLPLRSRERILGALVLFNTDSEHCFTPDDLSFGEDLASRAGLAFDNAILYTAAQCELAEREQIEQALRESQERLLLTTEAADVGMWSSDLVTGERYWDAKFCELMGYAPEEVPPELSSYDLMLPEDRPRIEVLVRQALDGRKPYEGEYRVTRKDGALRWIFAKGKGIYDEQGKPIRLVGVAFDVTRRKEIEARSRENLAQIEVHHRLMSQREQERRKIAQDLHDGPLQELIALTFLCSAAIDSTDDPQMIAQLEAIRDGLKERIGELRAFASELRPPALERFGLDKAIDSHLDSFKKKYPEIEIHMEAQTRNLIPPEQIGVALFRIYQESLNNIVRHARATGVTVVVGEHDRRITLEIRDNGQGFQLPEEWLDLARQGHLGLVGIHERAEALGGTAQVYSNPGKGTVIKVEIPL